MDNHENKPALHAAPKETPLAEEHIKEVRRWMRGCIPFH